MKLLLIITFNISLLNAQTNFDSTMKANSSLPEISQIKILTENCWIYRSKNPHFALKCGEAALKKAKAINNKNLQSKAMNLLGVVYRNLGNYGNSLSLYNNALKLAKEINDSVQIAYSYNNIGGIHRLEGNNPLALEYVLRALKIFEKINHKEGIAFCTINIGLIYKNQENYPKALEYLNKTFKIRNDIGDKPGKALTLNLIAEVYSEMKQLDDALKYYKKAENEYQALKDNKGLSSVWSGIGRVYFVKGNLSKALNFLMRAFDIADKVKYIEGQVTNLNNLALIYAKLGSLGEAESKLKQAQEIASKMNAAYLLLECYRTWAQLSELKKDYKNSLYYSRKYMTLKDSLMSQKNIAMVQTMESIYKAEKAEKENALLQKDIEIAERQRDYFVVVTLLILLISVITYSRYITKKIANEKLKELNAMKDTFFRILAHDLRIPFNIIFGYLGLLKENYDSLSEEEKLNYIDNMEKAAKQNYQLLENLLLWSRAQTGKLEIELIELDLQGIIMENFSILRSVADAKNVTLETSLSEGIKVLADENMLNTIFRNLIQNGIKFSNKGGKVFVSAQRENNFVKITIEDNGIGMDKETKDNLFELGNHKSRNGTLGESGTGIGLVLCKEFVEKLGGKIQVESEINKGSKFIVSLPNK